MAIKRFVQAAREYPNLACCLKNIQWRFSKTTSDLNCIFVLGCPRSGTTLVQRLLCTNTKLFSIEGETGLFSYRNIFHPRRRHFGLSPETLESLYGQCNDVVDFFHKCVALKSSQNDDKRFVEKTPQHILHLPSLLEHFPHAQFLHVVRDGRDCYCSARTNPHIPQNQSVVTFARYWRACIRKAAPFRDTDRIHTIRYETLCESPQQTLSDVMTFLGLELEEQQLDSQLIGDDRRATASYFKRLKEKVGSESIGRWKDEMSSSEIRTFERIAGNELRSYKYPTVSTP